MPQPNPPTLSSVVGTPVNGQDVELLGVGETAGDAITLYNGTTVVGTGVVAADGTFDIVSSSAFSDGVYNLTATETDAGSGLVSDPSTPLTVDVDPSVVTLNTASTTAPTSGIYVVTGVAEAGETVTVYADGGAVAIGSGVAAGDGTFSITTTTQVAGGPHTITAVETDTAGLSSTVSPSLAAAPVYRLATVGVTTPKVVVHVGDTLNVGVQLNNVDPTDGYSESLAIGVASFGGAVKSAVAPTGEIAPGSQAAFNPGILNVGFSSNAAGVQTGTVTLNLGSDGSAILQPNGTTISDGEGLTSAGQTTITVSAQVDNYAQAYLGVATTAGTVSGSTAAGYTVNLGTVGVNGATVTLTSKNSATGTADYLEGAYSVVNNGSFRNGTLNFQGLSAGKSSVTTVSTPDAAGTFTETLTLVDTGYNASGYAAQIGSPITVTITGTVVPIWTLTKAADTIIGGPSGATINTMSNDLQSTDVIDPTDGGNTLVLQGGGSFNLTVPYALAHIDTIDATEGVGAAAQTLVLREYVNSTVNVASVAGGKITITGATNQDVIYLGSGTDTVTLGTGESLVAGTGKDTVYEYAQQAGDLITGAGTNVTLNISYGGTITLNAADTGIGTVNLTGSNAFVFTASAEAGLIVNYAATVAGSIAAGAAGQVLTGGTSGKLTFVGFGSGTTTYKDKYATINNDTIQNYTAGDLIDLTNLAFSSKDTVTFTPNAGATEGVLDVSQNGKLVAQVTLFGQLAGATFAVQTDHAGGSLIVDTAPQVPAHLAVVHASGAR
jgi:hypothetical protein